MKKTHYVIVSVVVVLLGLIYRAVTKHVDGVDTERQWYVEQVGFDFNGRIDSVHPPGHIFFHVENGTIDLSREASLNGKLKYNGRVDLFLYGSNGSLNCLFDARVCHPGDCVVVRSDENKISVFRKKELVKERLLVSTLRGRPF